MEEWGDYFERSRADLEKREQKVRIEPLLGGRESRGGLVRGEAGDPGREHFKDC